MAVDSADGNEKRIIFHVDVNSAFLSWSAVKRLKEDPNAVDIRTIPSAVAGDIETRHGIITAKSLPAKKYGVKTAETVGSALRKCPDLVLVASDFKTYRAYSREFIRVLHRYSDAVEKASIDEAYVDMTEAVREAAPGSVENEVLSEVSPGSDENEVLRGAAISLAEKLKDEIREKLSFTVNVGISENKLLAKTASDFTKPDRIHTLWPEEVPEKLWPMPVRELFGCGAATAKRLASIGIETIGDAAHTDPEVLESLLGEKGGLYIFKSANGIGSDAVHSESEDAKTYSNELTTAEDVDRNNYATLGEPLVRELAEKVASRLERDSVYAKTIGVMVKTDTFHRRSRQTTLPESTNSTEIIRETALNLMNDFLLSRGGLFDRGDKIRLIGVSAGKIDKGEYRQISLFDYQKSVEEEKQAKKEEQRKREAEKRAQEEEKQRRLEAAKQAKVEEERLKRGREEQERRKKAREEGRREKNELQAQKQKNLAIMMEKVRSRYGEGSISKGMSINETDDDWPEQLKSGKENRSS